MDLENRLRRPARSGIIRLVTIRRFDGQGTPHHTSQQQGQKLYAVRDAHGRFKDIQTTSGPTVPTWPGRRRRRSPRRRPRRRRARRGPRRRRPQRRSRPSSTPVTRIGRIRERATLLAAVWLCAPFVFAETESEIRDRIAGTWKLVSTATCAPTSSTPIARNGRTRCTSLRMRRPRPPMAPLRTAAATKSTRPATDVGSRQIRPYTFENGRLVRSRAGRSSGKTRRPSSRTHRLPVGRALALCPALSARPSRQPFRFSVLSCGCHEAGRGTFGALPHSLSDLRRSPSRWSRLAAVTTRERKAKHAVDDAGRVSQSSWAVRCQALGANHRVMTDSRHL